MRFWASVGSHLPGYAADRAYIAGMDGIPWRGRNRLDDGILSLDRNTHESGCLVIPWRSSSGIGALSTGSLMERERPYHLAVELARGTLNRVLDDLGEFEQAGFRASGELEGAIAEARGAFIRAASSRGTPEEVTECAASSIESSLACVDRLCDERIGALIAFRRKQSPRLPTLLAGSLARRPPAPHEGAFLAAFNAASVPVVWRDLEADAGRIDWAELDQRVAWCERAGLRVCMGPLVQFDRATVPDWLYLWEDDFDQLVGCVGDFIRAVVSRYAGRVHVWQAIGRINVGGELALIEEHRLGLAVASLQSVRKEDPRTPAVIGLDQPWGEYLASEPHDLSPFHFADALSRSDLGLSGIGIEINLPYWPDGTYPRDPLDVGRHLDRWGTLGLPLLVSLVSPSSDGADPRSWRRHCGVIADPGRTTPESQRDLVARLVTLLIAKPAVHAVVWNQTTDAIPHDFPHGGLWDAEDCPKPILETLADIRRELLAY
ncbi:MAG: hypothetical protein FJ297_01415 [Planctomycetes bacterium]|nr:hypothetical protein [Planctomycetota bacterium]